MKIQWSAHPAATVFTVFDSRRRARGSFKSADGAIQLALTIKRAVIAVADEYRPAQLRFLGHVKLVQRGFIVANRETFIPGVNRPGAR